MKRNAAADPRSPLALLCDASPFTNAWLAQQLGLSEPGWWRHRMGAWKLNEERQALLADLLSVTRKRVQQAVDATVKHYNERRKEP